MLLPRQTMGSPRSVNASRRFWEFVPAAMTPRTILRFCRSGGMCRSFQGILDEYCRGRNKTPKSFAAQWASAPTSTAEWNGCSTPRLQSRNAMIGDSLLRFRSNPNLRAVSMTRSWRLGRTRSLPLRTRETVALLRPAARATSWIFTFDRAVFFGTRCLLAKAEIGKRRLFLDPDRG